MINIRQAMAMITGSALLYGASAAQAGGATGTITFSPVAATPVPILGSTLLVLLSLLLVFIAFVVFRRRQNGVASVIVGALALAALASAGGGVSVFHSAYAQTGTATLTNSAGQTIPIGSNVLNIYVNGSGVPLVPESPVFFRNDCKNNWAELNNACVVGSALADGAQCEINCRP